MIHYSLLRKIGLLSLLLWLSAFAPMKKPLLSVAQAVEAAPSSNLFEITYVGNWDQPAKDALVYATDIWSTAVYSPVPIKINASWSAAGSTGRPGSYLITGYSQQNSFPNPTAYYPLSLANALSQFPQTTGSAFYLSFNSDIPNWYFGTDGNAPSDAYDFVTVALKYIGHGLGIQSRTHITAVDGSWTSGGEFYMAYIYDTFVVNGSGQHLTDLNIFANPSPALRVELTSNNLYFSGSEATAVLNGTLPKLYAPADWQAIVQPLVLDDSSFPLGTDGALMTHFIQPGEVIHDPGQLTKAILYDLGWPKPRHAPTLNNLPNQLLLVNTNHNHALDLQAYANDIDTPIAQLSFSLQGTIPSEAGVTMENARYININPTLDWVGQVTVNILVTDPDNLVDSQSFEIIVAPQLYTRFLPTAQKP